VAIRNTPDPWQHIIASVGVCPIGRLTSCVGSERFAGQEQADGERQASVGRWIGKGCAESGEWRRKTSLASCTARAITLRDGWQPLLDAESLDYGGSVTVNENRVVLSGVVSSGTGGMVFGGPPGGHARFQVVLDGASEARLTYWMGDRALHQGAPTNPIDLTPTEP